MNRIQRLTALALAPIALLAACSNAATQDAERTDEGSIESEQDVGVLRLRVGDCVEQPAVGTEVQTLVAVPCDEPHTGEVLDAYDYGNDGDSFPGVAVLEASAQEECIARFDAITGLDFVTDPDWNLSWLYPSADSWSDADDREIVCLAVPLDGQPVTGPIARL